MADLNGYELTHKKIMDSGKANFLKDGYERANLRKICKDAGVTTIVILHLKIIFILYGFICIP
nr:hypothetical protein [[Haemophilus] ducreyi]